MGNVNESWYNGFPVLHNCTYHCNDFILEKSKDLNSLQTHVYSPGHPIALWFKQLNFLSRGVLKRCSCLCSSVAPEPTVLMEYYLSDYDAPLSVAGDYTTKYQLRNLFSLYRSECCVLLLSGAPHLLSPFLSSPFHLHT